jgi:hypothetical protein
MRARLLGWVGVLCLCGLVPPAAAQDPGKAPKKPGGCVDVSTEAAFASVGYDHIVTLKSGCKKPMLCTVKTNVNPDAASVKLDPGESQSVVTWRGSPAREFTADVSCVPARS